MSGHHPVKRRDVVVRQSDFRVRNGTVGGELAGGGRNGRPERSDYVWHGGTVEPDPHQLALIARAGLAGRQRRALATLLGNHLPPSAMHAVMAAADAYAAAAGYAVLAHPGLAAAAILAAAENDWRPCHCLCPVAHPGATGVCEPINATTERRIGSRKVQVCQPCADAHEAGS